MLPQVNAQLLTVTGPGYSEDYDKPATDGPLLLDGAFDAYVRETIRTSYSGSEGGLVKSKDVQLIVEADMPGFDDTMFKTGYVVKYSYRGTTYKRRIQDYTEKWMPGIPNPTLRLHLDSAPVDVATEVGT